MPDNKGIWRFFLNKQKLMFFRWNNNERRELYSPDVLLSETEKVDYLSFVTQSTDSSSFTGNTRACYVSVHHVNFIRNIQIPKRFIDLRSTSTLIICLKHKIMLRKTLNPMRHQTLPKLKKRNSSLYTHYLHFKPAEIDSFSCVFINLIESSIFPTMNGFFSFFPFFHFIPKSGSNPVLIASPPELAGMTLESRLVTYDWKNQFDSFQQVTRRGSFKAICWDAKNILIPVSHYCLIQFFFRRFSSSIYILQFIAFSLVMGIFTTK